VPVIQNAGWVQDKEEFDAAGEIFEFLKTATIVIPRDADESDTVEAETTQTEM
jgi:hypothetical protein